MANNFVDYVLDLETSGLRGWHSVREKFNPPRITQIGLIRVDPTNINKYTAVIGGGPGQGWTNAIGPLVDEYNPLSAEKLPAGFWKRLSDYDPSVMREGSILRDQVKRHVQAYIDAKATGNVGAIKSADEYINQLRTSIQKDIDLGNTVRLNAYNKGFDITQMVHELDRGGKRGGSDFMAWLNAHVKSGKVQIHGVEESIHRGMFEVMMQDASVMPRYASSNYFEKARIAGLQTVGLEATTPHYAMREIINDIRAIQGGTPAKQLLQGLPAEVQSRMSSIKSYSDFQEFIAWLRASPETKKEFMSHYRGVVSSKYGQRMGAHVTEVGFEYVSGWRQELISKLLRDPEVHHTALKDAISSLSIMQKLGDPNKAQELARQILTDRNIMTEEVASRYARFLEESALAVQRKGIPSLINIAHRTNIAPPAVVSRLARSPLTLPIMAAAGGLILADQIIRNATPVPQVESIKEEMKGKIEGLRRATSQWSVLGGINPSNMPFANASLFGSGRKSDWDSGSYRGVPISPDINYYRQLWSLHPEWQYAQAMQNAKSTIPTGFGPTREEIANRNIDLSDYIYELKDADTMLLRKAWLSSNVPIVGPAVGFLQRHLMNLTRTLTGQQFGFTVRIDNIDAPETAHGGGQYLPGAQRGADQATTLMDSLMRGSGIIQMLAGGRATHLAITGMGRYGRISATPYAGGKDIAGELVRYGGAVSTGTGDVSYVAQEELAAATNEGIWQYPEYQAVPEARRRGIYPNLAPLARYDTLTRDLNAQAMYSLMTYARNPQLHGIRDQHAQSMYVRR